MTGLEVTADAVLSDDGVYRYLLTRRWSWPDRLYRPATWIMLNPSTADHRRNDPTIRRCIRFAQAWGCHGLQVVNLYSYRATNPDDLWAAGDPQAVGHRDVVGPDGDNAIRSALELAAGVEAGPIVAAWGSAGGGSRAAFVQQVAADLGLTLQCLGTTKQGQPRHPLYVRSDTPLQPWTGRDQ